MAEEQEKQQAMAMFAGGCFWCMQPPFDALEGVLKTEVGYTGGHVPNPRYVEVSGGQTGHYEAIRVFYDPKVVGYHRLLETFWHNIDPTQVDGQFADRGSQYLTAIFYFDDAQKQLAEDSKAALEASGKFDQPISTRIEPASRFYPAEEYHQDYYRKNSGQYQRYKKGSGRAGFINRMWSGNEES